MSLYARILVPVDGTEFSEKAVREAAALAKALDSRLLLFHAAAPCRGPSLEQSSAADRPAQNTLAKKEAEDWARSVLTAAATRASLAGDRVEQHFAVTDSPYEAIILIARKFQCDLIVMASHGRRGVSGVLIGSETQKVLTHSLVPVLVVR